MTASGKGSAEDAAEPCGWEPRCGRPGPACGGLGEFRLRDLSQPEVIYQLTHADLPAGFPPIRTGDRADIAYATLCLACLAADASDWHQAAVLHGVAQALLDRTGLPWEDLEARYRQGSLDQVRACLGHEQFGRAYAGGMALSLNQALDLAFGEALQLDPAADHRVTRRRHG